MNIDSLTLWLKNNPPFNLSGAQLAQLTSHLIARELRPGGPYATNGALNPTLNQNIAKYLADLNIYLPSLDSFYPPKVKHQTKNNRDLKNYSKKLIAHLKSLPMIESSLKNIITQEVLRLSSRTGGLFMTSINYHFVLALGIDTIPKEKIIALDLANTFFWVAFIIYDDFWDQDEDADPKKLPAANLMARYYLQTYWEYSEQKPALKKILQELMVQADNANSWELAHCRLEIKDGQLILPTAWPSYGDYQRKFYPTAGQLFGPLSILSSLGYDLTDKTVSQLINYFRYHLIAKQINDDLHDWEEDLKRGHLSTVTLPLLKKFQRKFGVKKINLKTEKNRLAELYWHEVLTALARQSLKYSLLAEVSLKRVDFIKAPDYLLQFSQPSQRVAQEALSTHKTYQEFKEEYQGLHKTSL